MTGAVIQFPERERIVWNVTVDPEAETSYRVFEHEGQTNVFLSVTSFDDLETERHKVSAILRDRPEAPQRRFDRAGGELTKQKDRKGARGHEEDQSED